MSSTDLRYTLTLNDLFSRSMANAIGQADKLDSKMNRLSSGIGNQLRGAIAGVGVSYLANEMLTVGASFERAEIGLKTLLHSSVKAKEVFEDLKAESVRSPFSFETLLQGNRLLISAGVSASQAKKDFYGLSNAMAAVGGDEDALQRMAINLQQIKNVGRATALDIKQFGYAGINIYDLLNEYSTRHKIKLDMENVSYRQITAALNEAGQAGGRWYGATENLVNSTSGRLSNLKDSFKNLLSDTFQRLSPFINSVVEGLTSFFNLIKNNLDVIGRLARVIGVVVAGMYAFKLITGGIALFQAVKFALAIATMTAGLQGATIAQVALNTAMALNPIGLVIIALGALFLAYQEWVSYMNKVEEMHKKTALQTAVNNGIIEETNRVNELGRAYENAGLKKSDAMKKALIFEIAATNGAIKELEGKAGSEDALKVLYAQQKKLSSLGSPYGLGASISDLNTDPATKGAAAIGSGTEVSAARPQNLTINITKLVETLNLQAANLKEGALQIKEAVAKALIEAVNDVNTVTR